MNPNHALLVGNVLGALMVSSHIENIEPIMKDGNYTSSMIIKRGDTEYIVSVTPME